MSSKTFCPIMTIGFDPPEKGKRDLRLCTKDCTWYNVSEEKCELNVISEYMISINTNISDVSDYLSDMALEKAMEADTYDDFEVDETTAAYYSGYLK